MKRIWPFCPGPTLNTFPQLKMRSNGARAPPAKFRFSPINPRELQALDFHSIAGRATWHSSCDLGGFRKRSGTCEFKWACPALVDYASGLRLASSASGDIESGFLSLCILHALLKRIWLFWNIRPWGTKQRNHFSFCIRTHTRWSVGDTCPFSEGPRKSLTRIHNSNNPADCPPCL